MGGLRPGSPDELPLLGQVPGFSNAFIGAGHFRSGLQMSPATGMILADLMLGQTPAISLEGLRADRFSARIEPVGSDSLKLSLLFTCSVFSGALPSEISIRKVFCASCHSKGDRSIRNNGQCCGRPDSARFYGSAGRR